MAIINAQGQEIPETWTYGQAETPLAPHVIVPLAALPPAGEPLPSPLGVQLPPETQAESIAARLGDFTLIAIEFPKFRDGRGFTLARTLREKYGYTGDIRAVGHFIPDQFVFLLRCGFSTLLTPPEHPAAQWRLPTATSPENPAHPGQLLHRLVSRGRAA
jgi:uncharacterized protein (DUF934 family)